MHNTGNPLPSKDILDLYDNSEVVDNFVNSQQDEVPDRFGVKRLTLAGLIKRSMALRNEINDFSGAMTFKPEWTDVPMNVSEGVGGEGGALNLQAEALGNRLEFLNGRVLKNDAASNIPFVQAGDGGLDRKIKDRINDFLSINDFETQIQCLNAAKQSGGMVLDFKNKHTLTIGPGYDFETITAGIEFLVKIKPLFKNKEQKCKLILANNFIMKEQIIINNGEDLGWIIIESGSNVLIDPTAITEKLSEEDDLIPIFGASNGSILPSIKTLFKYPDRVSSKDGIAVIEKSGVYLFPGSGVQMARNGLKVLYGSWAYSYIRGLVVGGAGTGGGDTKGVDFSLAKNRGLHVAHGSVVGLARSNFSNSGGDYGVYCIWNSFADLYQSDASGAAGTAFCSRDGSGINCRESCAARSKRGYHALHNGKINARSKQDDVSSIWVKDSARGCSEYGILASGCSQIEAAEVDVSGCTGSAGCSASDASSVSFQLGIATGCTTRGIYSSGGSSIQADGVDVSNSNIGINAISGGSVSATSASKQVKINNCLFGVLTSGTSIVDVARAEINGCDRGVEARDSSIINARGAKIESAHARAVSCIDGANINAMETSLINSLDRAITCRNGGRVAAYKANCTGAVYLSVEVQNGGQVSFHEGLGDKFNTTINTLTSLGIIFK